LRLGLLSAAVTAAIYICGVLLLQGAFILAVRLRLIWGIELPKSAWPVYFGLLWVLAFAIAWPLSIRLIPIRR